MEHRAAVDSGEVTLAKNPGVVIYADAAKIIVKHAGGIDEYHLAKFQRSNQSSCINHRPIVRVRVTRSSGRRLADGPSPITASSHWARTSSWHTCRGKATTTRTLSSCPSAWWPKTCSRPSISPNTRVDARDTKLGPEEITREIPNLSEDMTCRPRRGRHHPHRRRGVPWRHPGRQGHA